MHFLNIFLPANAQLGFLNGQSIPSSVQIPFFLRNPFLPPLDIISIDSGSNCATRLLWPSAKLYLVFTCVLHFYFPISVGCLSISDFSLLMRQYTVLISPIMT